MLIRVVSDLHLEFIPLRKREEVQEQIVPYLADEKDMVLVLAGDTGSADIREDITPWIKDLSQRHRAVVMVCGNHEGYHGSIEIANTYWHYMAAMYPSLYVLENETLMLDDVKFIGATLWTSLSDPMDEIYVRQMSDFDFITGWSIARWKYAHNCSLNYITAQLGIPFMGKTVVVTHHLPTFSSVGKYYINDKMNGCYATNLDNLIAYNDIALWCHGHTHVSSDYMAGDTRIVCNPHGYHPHQGHADARNRKFKPSLTVEV
jgi:predicted phosphodiesterase